MVFQKALETAIHVFETKGYTPYDVLTVDAIQTDTYKANDVSYDPLQE